MKPYERSNYRNQQLRDLYDYYFAHKLESKDVTREVRENTELRAAYIYLNQKGLLNYEEKLAGHSIAGAYVKINAYGMDVVEQENS